MKFETNLILGFAICDGVAILSSFFDFIFFSVSFSQFHYVIRVTSTKSPSTDAIRTKKKAWVAIQIDRNRNTNIIYKMSSKIGNILGKWQQWTNKFVICSVSIACVFLFLFIFWSYSTILWQMRVMRTSFYCQNNNIIIWYRKLLCFSFCVRWAEMGFSNG